jgi:DNA helicase-2/ATP-dependent DNA helicase PcrA
MEAAIMPSQRLQLRLCRISLTMTQIFSGLNESQKKAVVNTEGPVLIVAGPGTGKTLTIVRRIAYLIHQRVQPETILALTFTNRAAREMRERTEALLGSEVSRVFIGTFHLFGLRMIIDASASLPGMGGDAGWSNFVIYNRGEQLDLLKTIAKDIGLGKIEQKGRRLSYQKLLEKISRHKNLLEDIDEGIKITYEEYQSALRKNNALDFDDLILRPIEILHDNKVLEKYRNKFRYFMVDEYQDINPAQYKLLRLLVHSRGNICAIGDSDQAIYAFKYTDKK